MIDLPKRSDSIYKEIEKFEDYEFTNCIAYEMAIRNKEVKELLKQYDDLFNEKVNELNRKELLDKLSKFGFPHIPGYGLNLKDIKFSDKNGKTINNKEEQYFQNITQYFLTKSSDITKENYNKLFCDYTIEPRIPKLNIKTNRYTLSFENIRKADIELNLDLPKDELIAYISKIKDEYDKDNSLIKCPLELLGESLEKENIDIKNLPKRDIKKMYADMFYIYDYFNFREDEYKLKRIQLKEKLTRDEKETNKIWDYDSTDKRNKIERLKYNYKVDKKNYSKEEIKNKLTRELDFNITKINDYLKIMKTFIDNTEYKKLITGGVKLY